MAESLTTSRLLSSGSMRLTGPAELLETPSDEEIRAALNATTWRTGFHHHGAQEDHRLGLIETRVQLEYLCAQVWMGESFPSWARRRGVTTQINVRPRPSARTVAGSGSSPKRSR